jgi:hypothetical protein
VSAVAGRALYLTPRDVDPLSWIARPWVAIFFSATAFVSGTSYTITHWSVAPRPWLDAIATVLIVGACLWIQISVRPLKRSFGPLRASVSIILGLLGLAASAIAAYGSPVPVQLWWAPIGLGVIVAACAAYSAPLHIASYGAIFSLATTVASLVVFGGENDSAWSALSAAIISVTPILVGLVVTLVFSVSVVSSSQRLISGANSVGSRQTEADLDEAARAYIDNLARLGSRVAPFLSSVAESGQVTDADRALAGQLARRLRAELVTQANTSWLESLATIGRIHVVDPEHRADRLNAAQRSALRGLIETAVNDPSTHAGSIFIELRGHDDGSTKVALSIDLDLPEGRRIMMIAPYYLALKTAVSDISWDAARDLLQFTAPPGRRW